MFIVKYYIAIAVASFLAASVIPFVAIKLVFVWIGVSLSLVSFAYIFQIPRIFRKKQDGSIPLYIRWLFVPFLLGAQIYNSWSRKYDKVPAIQKIEDDLYLACRLFPSDIDALKNYNIHSILDVTAEFDGLDWTASNEHLHYLNIPTLDHQSPSEKDLVEAINWINNHRQPGKGVVVHCALGRGRSVLVVAAYLLSKSANTSVEQVLQQIQQSRATAGLNRHQLKKLRTIHQSGVLSVHKRLAIIANPVSGGGKWSDNKEEIIQRLSSYYQIQIYLTTQKKNATHQAQAAAQQGTDYFLACGGDGTITEVASVAVDKNIPLGIMPMGTANALGHAIYGTSSKIIPVEVACEALIAGLTKRIDTAICNNELMLLVAAVGFEQKMIANADRAQKNQGGQLAYLEALADAVSNNQSNTLKVTFDHQQAQTLNTASLVVANAAPFTTVLAQGGGEPDFADGELDVTWLTDTPYASDHMFNLIKLAIGGLSDGSASEQIKHCSVKSIQIRCDDASPIPYVIDGENRSAEQLDIEIKPASLDVFVSPY